MTTVLDDDLKDELPGAVLAHLRSLEGMNLTITEDTKTFEDMGADSLTMLMVVGEFEERLDTELPPHLLWDAPDLDRFVAYLAENVEAENLRRFVRAAP